MYIAVDFDGTIVSDRYPEIGKELPFATATLRQLMGDGHKLILWTVREGELLQEAVDWCEKKGVRFYAVNKDYDEEATQGKHYSRKLKADIFIDDRGIAGLPDWGTIYELIKQRINWEEFLIRRGEIAAPAKKKWWQF